MIETMPRSVTICLAFIVSFASSALAVTYVGNLNGAHSSSTFTTSTDGTLPITSFNWIYASGAASRVFGQTGGTTNDVLIAGGSSPFANYGVQYNTNIALLPN